MFKLSELKKNRDRKEAKSRETNPGQGKGDTSNCGVSHKRRKSVLGHSSHCWVEEGSCKRPLMSVTAILVFYSSCTLNPSPGIKLSYCCQTDQQICVHRTTRPTSCCLWRFSRLRPFLRVEDCELVWLLRAGLLQFFVCRSYQPCYPPNAADTGCSSSESFWHLVVLT